MEADSRREIFKTAKNALRKPLNYCNFASSEFDVITGEKRGRKPKQSVLGSDFEGIYEDFRNNKQTYKRKETDPIGGGATPLDAKFCSTGRLRTISYDL